MNKTAEISTEQASPEEVERRIEEYRRLGFERRLPAQVVYSKLQWPCPWSECNLLIAAIHFQLEKFAEADVHDRLLAAWWKGPGLMGRCPSCNQYVLYGLRDKKPIKDPTSIPEALMPERWYELAHLVIKPSKENSQA